jgi:RNA polymerase sigma-70 factor (ECF subfamily)
MEGAGDITQLLLSWDNNRDAAVQNIIPALYSELHKIAASLMRRERTDHTLQPTVLIHEAYLRLVRQDSVTWKDRAHFFGIAARLMRQILVDHARRRCAAKRSGIREPVLSDNIAVNPGNPELLVDLDDALLRMAAWDERKLQVMELHYFGGLRAEEIGEALNLSLPTVRRELLLGRAWLRDQFSHSA